MPEVNPLALVIRVSAAGLRDTRGRYAPRAHILEEQARFNHMQMAKRLQREAAAGIAVGSRRPGTGRLKSVTMDERNIVYSPQGYGVGVPSFLNKSAARYWRTIEEGSAETFRRGGFAGSLIYPEIGKKGIGASRAEAWHSGVDPTGRFAAGSPFAPFPTGKIAAISHIKGAELARRFPNYHPIVVKNEIQPQRYYANAWESLRNEVEGARADKVLLDRAWKGPGA